jgi:flagellar biosynthetic protein FliR
VHFTFAPATLIGFSLVLVRATAFVVLCPPFNSPSIPVRIRLGFAAALAFVLAHDLGPKVGNLSTAAFVGAMGMQFVAGVGLAVFVFVIFQALQAAGELIDLQVGFSLGGILDPLSGNQSTPIGRFNQLLAIAILFAINGHVLVVRAFIESVQAAPFGHISTSTLASELVRMLGVLIVAAVEIALPILAALFCTEIALGLLGKAAPQLNIMVLGFGVKAFLAFTLLAATLVLLPASTESLIGQAIHAAGRIFRG